MQSLMTFAVAISHGMLGWSAGAEKTDRATVETCVHSDLYGAEMVRLAVAGAPAFILRPPKPPAFQEKPWIWFAPARTDANGQWTLPEKHHAWLFRRVLESGFHVVGIDVGESYGSPAGRATFDKFYRHLVHERGLARKAALLPVSRGGLMAYNWAAEHPQCVRAIGAIYPVCNLESYPGLTKVAGAYGLTPEQLRAELARHNPIERLAPLAAAGVPILHVHGDRDKVVPLETNSGEVARRYAALGGRMELAVPQGKGHEIVPDFWQCQRLVDFFNATCPPPAPPQGSR